MFSINKLHPLVWVFESALKNPEKIIQYYNDENQWESWYIFGNIRHMSVGKLAPGYFDKFPSEAEWKQEVVLINENATENENLILSTVADTFYQATKIYMEDNYTSSPKFMFDSFSLAFYHPGQKMSFHTDNQQDRKLIPEYKFHTTALFYLNDDYIGGELTFVILNPEQTEIEQVIQYKPVAGDLIVFPSTIPFYHGSMPTQDGKKYLIRAYWKSYQEPDNYWKMGLSKYGEEQWREMKEQEAKLYKNNPTFVLFNHEGKEYWINKVDVPEKL